MKRWSLAIASLLLPAMAFAQQEQAQQEQQEEQALQQQQQQPQDQVGIAPQPQVQQPAPQQQMQPMQPQAMQQQPQLLQPPQVAYQQPLMQPGFQQPLMQPGFQQPFGFQQPGFVAGVTPWAEAAERGIIQGVVTNVNYSRGLLSVRSGNQSFIVRAKPQQLALYRPGELTTIHYANYAGVPWMIENRSAQLYSPTQFAQASTVVGVVTGVNKATGVVGISRGAGQQQTFLGHPNDVEALLPGQFIALTFARIGGQGWIQSIAPATETGIPQ